VRVVGDPRQPGRVEVAAGTSDSYVGQAGFGLIDRPGDGEPGSIMFVSVRGWCEAGRDASTAFGLMCGGGGDLRVRLTDQPVHGVQDGFESVFVDEVGEGLQVAAGRVMLGVFAQCGPRR
jgi:hypothetical protein